MWQQSWWCWSRCQDSASHDQICGARGMNVQWLNNVKCMWKYKRTFFFKNRIYLICVTCHDTIKQSIRIDIRFSNICREPGEHSCSIFRVAHSAWRSGWPPAPGCSCSSWPSWPRGRTGTESEGTSPSSPAPASGRRCLRTRGQRFRDCLHKGRTKC